MNSSKSSILECKWNSVKKDFELQWLSIILLFFASAWATVCCKLYREWSYVFVRISKWPYTLRHVPDLGDVVSYWAATFWMTDGLSTFFTTKNPLLFHWSWVALTIIFREHLSLWQLILNVYLRLTILQEGATWSIRNNAKVPHPVQCRETCSLKRPLFQWKWWSCQCPSLPLYKPQSPRNDYTMSKTLFEKVWWVHMVMGAFLVPSLDEQNHTRKKMHIFLDYGNELQLL